MPPYEARLIVNPAAAEGHYTAHWLENGGQPSDPFNLTLPLTQADSSDLRWYLETYLQLPGAGDHARAAGIERNLDEWGRAMWQAVFGPGEGREVYRNLMDAPEPRLLTIGAIDPALLTQPWEMMRDRRGPLAFQGVIIRRQLLGSERPRRYALQAPLRVLLIVSRPSDTGFIDPRNSIPPLLDALDSLPPGQVQVDFCDPPTLAHLEETLAQARRQQRPYHIVHFDGHGTYLPLTGVGALAFERADATADLVSGSRLGDLLARLEVPLVLLEACRSAGLSDRPVFGSVAPALLASGVGSVIAFSHAVHVQAARLLVERFYRELTAGQSIGQALLESRLALRADPARWLHLGPHAESIALQDWFIPQLYQVGADLAIVVPHPQPLSQVGRGEQPLTGGGLCHFPPPPLYHFHGRAPELLALERAFRRYPAALVSGMGGMGKTALSREAAAWWLRTGRFEAAVFCPFEQKAGAERVVQLLGQALEGDAFSARPAADQWATAVELFHRRRVLLVWDNFESTLPIYQQGEAPPSNSPQRGENERKNLSPAPSQGENVASPPGSVLSAVEGGLEGGPDSPLQFGADARARLHQLYRDLTDPSTSSGRLPAGRLLITCRPAETGLPDLKELPLAGLARPDSLHLLAAILDLKGIPTDRPGYERPAIDSLLDALADHPLSIELVAPHLKNLPPAQIKAEFGALLARFSDDRAHEGRNRSLLASLEFSKRRLSPETQAILPSLAWFEGGVFEAFLLDFATLQPEAWQPIRAELEATALIRVEELEEFNTPYLRFHPTLAYAATKQTSKVSRSAFEVSPSDDPEARFIEVYLAVRQVADDALRGRQPAAGMALVAHEEANLRAAITYAFRRGERLAAGQMAGTLGVYLQMAGRLRERDSLAQWVRASLPAEAGLDAAACAAILDHAWSRFTQGQAEEALGQVQELIARLEAEGLAGGGEATFQIAMSYSYLGQIYVNAGRADLALEPSQKAITMFEGLGDAQRGNLAATLGNLANAYAGLGRFDEALAAAERGLAINRDLGRDREIAVGLGQIAQILRQQQRYAEAEARYEEALRAARAAGDQELQGALLQHQGLLQMEQSRYPQAVELYKQALRLFQQANNPGNEMQTCDLLATAERKQGHLDAAEAWYARSRELALKLGDRRQQAVVAQNLGILYQTRAEQAPDPVSRAALLRQAAAAVEESLAITLEMQDQVGAESSFFQLGVLCQMQGDLDRAEEYLLKATEISEALNLPEVYKNYGILAAIARDRGDGETAAGWQAKYEAKVRELERLRRGEQGSGVGQASGLPPQFVQAILALAQAAYQARVSGSALELEAAEALAHLAELPPPFGAVGRLLQAVAAGQLLPAVPPGLPPEVGQILAALDEALRQ